MSGVPNGPAKGRRPEYVPRASHAVILDCQSINIAKPSFCLGKAGFPMLSKLRQSFSFPLQICEASLASSRKVVKAQGFFKGSTLFTLLSRKTPSSKITIEIVWLRNLLAKKLTESSSHF